MSQARQIYAYALGGQAGLASRTRPRWSSAPSPSMVRDYRGRDGRGGWIFSIRRDGTVADPRRDLYTHDLRASGDRLLCRGDRQAARRLPSPTRPWRSSTGICRRRTGGGFVEELPPNDGLRRQNPHMHLFEGLLSLWECSGEERYLTRAGGTVRSVRLALLPTRSRRLGEYFTADLRPADGVAGSIVEPGHHYEWIWLLRRFEQTSGRSVQPYVDALYGHADRYGFDGPG